MKKCVVKECAYYSKNAKEDNCTGYRNSRSIAKHCLGYKGDIND